MDPRLQRRVQRYGWDLAADRYEASWQAPLAPAQRALLGAAQLRPGERVLDVACGTGLVAFAAAEAMGPSGRVLGVDVSARMVEAARRQADTRFVSNAAFERMDGEALALADGSVDVALCALGLMYMPEPERAIAELHRVLRPGGRLALAVWGERGRCGWSALFDIVDAEVASEVCPLFFRLGTGSALAEACAEAGFADVTSARIDAPFEHADDAAACSAAFEAGPVALAWSRFNAETRERVQRRYLEALKAHGASGGYRIPGEFVVTTARC